MFHVIITLYGMFLYCYFVDTPITIVSWRRLPVDDLHLAIEVEHLRLGTCHEQRRLTIANWCFSGLVFGYLFFMFWVPNLIVLRTHFGTDSLNAWWHPEHCYFATSTLRGKSADAHVTISRIIFSWPTPPSIGARSWYIYTQIGARLAPLMAPIGPTASLETINR